MTRTLEDFAAAIKQIRDYASAYQGKRKDFYDNLYAMLATPIPQNEEDYPAIVKKMYLAAIGSLTSEIQPPTAETYIDVVRKLNSALEGEKLGLVNIADYPDEGMEDKYSIVGEARTQDLPTPRIEQLQNALPRKRKLTKKNQALLNKFRLEIPTVDRPFVRREQSRG